MKGLKTSGQINWVILRARATYVLFVASLGPALKAFQQHDATLLGREVKGYFAHTDVNIHNNGDKFNRFNNLFHNVSVLTLLPNIVGKSLSG